MNEDIENLIELLEQSVAKNGEKPTGGQPRTPRYHEDIMNVVRTQDLIGPALDWAVATCEGFSSFTDGISRIVNDRDKYRPLPAYSTDWSQGGPIIEREIVSLDKEEGGKRWAAFAWRSDRDLQRAIGHTPLIAAMRCYVASKLGNTVEVPESLETSNG